MRRSSRVGLRGFRAAGGAAYTSEPRGAGRFAARDSILAGAGAGSGDRADGADHARTGRQTVRDFSGVRFGADGAGNSEQRHALINESVRTALLDGERLFSVASDQ